MMKILPRFRALPSVPPVRAFVVITLLAVGLAGGCTRSAPVGGRTVYYVDGTAGNDENDGTSPSTAWRTPGRAASRLGESADDDTVLFRGGIYHDVLRPAHNGTPERPLVFKAVEGEHVVLDGLPDNDLNVIWVSRNDIVLEGLEIRNGDYANVHDTPGYWVFIGGQRVRISRCSIIAPGDARAHYEEGHLHSRGIALENAQDVIIERTLIRGLAMGVVMAGTSPRRHILREDTLLACYSSHVVCGGSSDGSTAPMGVLIDRCVMDTTFEEDNIQFEPGSTNAVAQNQGTIIRSCLLANAAENAIDMKGAGVTLIERNLIYGTHGDDNGSAAGCDRGSGPAIERGGRDRNFGAIVRQNVVWDCCGGLMAEEAYQVYNNTFLNNRRDCNGSNNTDRDEAFTAITIWDRPAFHRVFLNNIISQSNFAVYRWYMEDAQNILVDHNLYVSEAGTPQFYHRIGGAMVMVGGLSAWQKVLRSQSQYRFIAGKDSHSVALHPGFRNVPLTIAGYDPAWDFSLAPGSPARGAGACVTRTLFTTDTLSALLGVADARPFVDGFGVTTGDRIRIGSSAPVVIASVDYDRNVLVLKEPRRWKPGEGVHIVFEGDAPDIGAGKIR